MPWLLTADQGLVVGLSGGAADGQATAPAPATALDIVASVTIASGTTMSGRVRCAVMGVHWFTVNGM